MASNQRKEEIRIEWRSNYNEAINQIEQVKSSLTNNAYEVDKLNQAQYRLDAEYKKFEQTLDKVDDSLKDNEASNNELASAIEKLQQRIDKADEAIVDYKKHLDDVVKTNDDVVKSADRVSKAQDKVAQAQAKSNKSNKDLSKSNKDLSNSNKDVSLSSEESSVLFQRLDEVTFGLASNFRDLIGVNGGLKASLTATQKEFGALNVFQKATVVATNATKIAIRGLMVASGIGALVIAVGAIAEHWDDIVDGAKGFLSETYKINNQLIKNNKQEIEKLEKIDNQTEQLKLQGFTDEQINKKKLEAYNEILKKEKENLEAIKQKDMETLKWTTNIKVKFLESIGWVVKGLGSLIKFVYTPAEKFLEMISNSINSIVDSSVGKFLGLKGTVDLTFVNSGVDKVVESVESYVKKKTDEWKQADYEASEEYLEQLKRVEDMEEKRAGQQNRVNDANNKKGSSSNNSDLEKQRSLIESAQKLLADYKLDLQALNADDLFSKKHAELDKQIYDSNQKLKDSLKTLGEAYKENSEEYIKGKQAIEEYHRQQIEGFEAEKSAMDSAQESAKQLVDEINNSDKSRKEIISDIENFLLTIEDNDAKSFFADMFNLDDLKATEDFVNEQLKLKEQQFEYNENLTSGQNQRELDNITKHNLQVLEAEKIAFEQKKEFLEATYEEQQAMLQQFVDRKKEIEQSHSDASAQINQITADQTKEIIHASMDMLGNMNQALGDNFEFEKGLAVGKSVMNTYEGVTANLKQPQPYGGIMAGITLAAGLASVIQILKTEPNVSSAGSLSAGSVNLDGALTQQPNVQFQQSSESQLAQTIQNQATEPVKAYVVSKDVTSQQQKDSIKRNNSSL